MKNAPNSLRLLVVATLGLGGLALWMPVAPAQVGGGGVGAVQVGGGGVGKPIRKGKLVRPVAPPHALEPTVRLTPTATRS